jgi:CRISPR-associated endonuclease/helicase Cas3
MILAHYNRKTNDSQTLEEHLKNVEDEMGKGLETVSFSESILDKKTIVETGKFHDLGKITKWFQIYLKTGKYTEEKNHALLSATLYEMYRLEKNETVPFLSMVAITCHHKNLTSERPEGRALDYLESQYKNCIKQSRETVFSNQVSSREFKEKMLTQPWRRTLKSIEKEENPEYFFALQFLFSKLISADKRDSAEVLNYHNTSSYGDVDEYLAKKTKGKLSSVNNDRQEIKKSVLDKINLLSEKELDEQKIFTLTAPTGTGKTLTSIAAAVLLANRLEEKNSKRPHIIIAVPFLNILEQTLQDCEGIFGEVLVHSSAVSPFDNYRNNEEPLTLQKKMLLTSSWSSSVVLTTFVQLFESIFSSENSRLLKVNRLVNAIVILDEVQALEAEKYPLYAVTLDMLAKCYGTRFIMMTATQPKLFDCAKFINYELSQRSMELLPDYQKYFKKLKRTKLVSLMNEITNFDELCEYIESQNLFQKKILIVVNRIMDSIELYQKLTKMSYKVLYLSTNLTRRDRKRVIKQAKKWLEDSSSEPFIMVSTQTIEAGVDLDFDIAFRDLAPMESIIQTAGRINRSGNKEDLCPIYIFNTNHANGIYSTMAILATKNELQDKEFVESEYQMLVEDYYNTILNNENVSFERKIYREGVLKLDYKVIDEFKMIQDGNRYSVIFLQEENAEEIVRELCTLITSEDTSFERNAKIQQKFSELEQYTVDIFAKKLKNNRPISFADYAKEICGYRIELNYFIVPKDDLERYYDETGFISKDAGVFMY